jgi:polar amino acid transport system substrate-binding protein
MYRITRRHLAVSGGAAMALSWAPIARAASDALDDIMAAGRIRAGIFEDLPPFSFMGPDAKLQGYDIDICQFIATDLGVRLEQVGITGQNRIPNMIQGRVDFLLAVGKSEEREKVIDFTDAYAPYYIAVIGPKSLSAKTPADLAGNKVAVVRGTVGDTRLTAIAAPGTDIRRFETYSSVISAFLSGQTQFMVVGSDIAATVRAQHPANEPDEKFQLMSSANHIGINKNQERFKARLNQIIGKLHANGALNRLSEKWLLKPLPADF